jgi:CBS domain-containing membrane protein
VPILAGATLRDRLLACVVVLLGVALTSFASAMAMHGWAPFPLLVATIGVSPVLVLAVPASPLAQPWWVVGGNVDSTLVCVTAAHFVPPPFWRSELPWAVRSSPCHCSAVCIRPVELPP